MVTNYQWILEKIKARFPAAQFLLKDQRGDDQHFLLTFDAHVLKEEKSLVARHRKIYEALDNMRDHKIHALSIELKEF